MRNNECYDIDYSVAILVEPEYTLERIAVARSQIAVVGMFLSGFT